MGGGREETVYPPIYYPSTFSRKDARRISFDKQEHADNINITLRKDGGLVLTGTVRDAAGQPVPEAFVVVHRRDMLFDFNTAYTDQQGRYRIHGLADGEFLVHVDAVHRGWVRTRTPLDLAGSSQPPELNFTLARGATLAGRFVDDTGHDWQIGQSFGYAHVVSSGPFDVWGMLWPFAGPEGADGTFSLTNFRNKHRPHDTEETPAVTSPSAKAITSMATCFSRPKARLCCKACCRGTPCSALVPKKRARPF